MLGRFERAGHVTDTRVETNVAVDLTLNLARFASSSISSCDYDLKAVIHHYYPTTAKGAQTDNFKAFVRELGTGQTNAQVWKDFSTIGEPVVPVETVTRAHDGCVPYVLLYELRPTKTKSTTGQAVSPKEVSDRPVAKDGKPGPPPSPITVADSSASSSAGDEKVSRHKEHTERPGDTKEKPIELLDSPGEHQQGSRKRKQPPAGLPYRPLDKSPKAGKRQKGSAAEQSGLADGDSRLAFLAQNVNIFKTQHEYFDECRRACDDIIIRIEACQQGERGLISSPD